MNGGDLVGTWRLSSWEIRPADGHVFHPYGLEPKGLLVYTSNGYMSAAIMRAKRPRVRIPVKQLMNLRRLLSSRPWLLLTAWRKLGGLVRYVMAAADYLSYSGRYEVRGDKLIHHVEVSLIPDWAGVDLERTFELNDNTLSLRVSVGDTQQYLVWKRAFAGESPCLMAQRMSNVWPVRARE